MKHFKILLLFVFAAFISFTSCESVNEAQEVADGFYAALNSEDYSALENMLDKEAVNDELKEQFMGIFAAHNDHYGKITSHSKYAFETNSENGLTVVLLKFTVETEKGKVYELLRFVKRDDGYKIIAYQYNIDKGVIDSGN